MKQPVLRRPSLKFHSLPTSTVNKFPHDATITAKPDLRKRSGELNPNDPRFIGYSIISGESQNTVVERTCNLNYTLSTSGQFYSCCPINTSLCSFATNCIGSSYELFNGGVSSRCSSYCVTGVLYSATNDKSPLTHVGCGYDNYNALRNTDTNLLGTWPPSQLTPWPTVGYTNGEENPSFATPTPGQVFDLPTEAVWGPGTSYELTFNFTKLSGGIVGGVVLVGLIILCILGKRKRNREERERRGEIRRVTEFRRRGFHPTAPVALGSRQEEGIVRYTREHELVPVPSRSPDLAAEYPVPAYQMFEPQAQRAGYQHILGGERSGHDDDEALLQQSNPLPYVDPDGEMTGRQTQGQ